MFSVHTATMVVLWNVEALSTRLVLGPQQTATEEVNFEIADQVSVLIIAGPKFQALDLGVSSCYEIGTRVYTSAKALYVSNVLS